MTRRSTDQRRDTLSRPARWSVLLMRLASNVLPPSVRGRYQRELISELYGMDRWTQLRHVGGVLSSVMALRRAVTQRASDLEEAEMKRRPIMCTVNLHHVWRKYSTEDGGRYSRCIRCGKDHPGSTGFVGSDLRG